MTNRRRSSQSNNIRRRRSVEAAAALVALASLSPCLCRAAAAPSSPRAAAAFLLPPPRPTRLGGSGAARPRRTNLPEAPPLASMSYREARDGNDGSGIEGGSSGGPSATRPTTTTTSRPQRTLRYVRLQPKGRRRFEVQTAVTTFAKPHPTIPGQQITVDLHSNLHLGDRTYFEYYNDPELFAPPSSAGAGSSSTGGYDRSHFELIVSQDLIYDDDSDDGNGHGGMRRRIQPTDDGRSPIVATVPDSNLAGSYGLSCQADVINFARDGWVVADLSREEFLEEVAKRAEGGRAGGSNDDDGRARAQPRQLFGRQPQSEQPLWSLASTAAASDLPGSDLLTALLRPSNPSLPPSAASVPRRLFSNLFLPGDALTSLIRAVLWTAVPCPEVNVVLLDWSSLSPRPTGGISPVALPVLECLLSGNVREARKLVFGQVVVGGQLASDSNAQGVDGGGRKGAPGDVLIAKRNERAMDVLRSSIERDGCRRNALVYGAAHCPDLHRRLLAEGFVPTGRTEWRTAWSVDVPRFGTGRRVGRRSSVKRNGSGSSRSIYDEAFAATSSPVGLAVALVFVPAYLAVGGLDWLSTIHDVGTAAEAGNVVDGILVGVLYLVRHVAMYLGLAKFVVEWDGGGVGGTDGEVPRR